ncbi:uncharacterized protein YALI1_A00019g [Yarrowia lipolytica]|uniref:Uncharacterized protein n=1 Tax=Yarrowia lipolytica TaxID=4952 RepID=A0A1D8N371_YARLL|nr:hypothetical protein YALI1_A00019g [Yarrowia lipolytica]
MTHPDGDAVAWTRHNVPYSDWHSDSKTFCIIRYAFTPRVPQLLLLVPRDDVRMFICLHGASTIQRLAPSFHNLTLATLQPLIFMTSRQPFHCSPQRTHDTHHTVRL